MKTNRKCNSKAISILLIDDDATFSKILHRELSRMKFDVDYVNDGPKGIKALEKRDYDVVLLDIFMPETDGLNILEIIKKRFPDTIVIMLTGYGTIDTAIKSMKMGAFDYLTKPFRLDELKISIEKSIEIRRLAETNVTLKQGLAERKYSEMIGKSEAIRKVFGMIDKVAPSNSTVLLTGESGTGKELVARAIHRSSPRSEEPFVIVDCGALHENLFESELFGHEKGAYTGAVKRKHGLFEVADGGTVFLDEISEVNLTTQAKLLRVIETGEFRRLGDAGTIRVDARVVAATNRDLEKMVADRLFRKDLYYRLNVFRIQIPPLRERKDDLRRLVEYFLNKRFRYSNETGRISAEAMNLIMGYDWPGNVRELKNALERALILSDNNSIDVKNLPAILRDNFSYVGSGNTCKPLAEIEDEYINYILEKCGGNRTRAAAILGIDPKTIYRRIRGSRE